MGVLQAVEREPKRSIYTSCTSSWTIDIKPLLGAHIVAFSSHFSLGNKEKQQSQIPHGANLAEV